jgi:hypothetical protein
MTDARTPRRRTIQATSDSADLKTDARRQAGFRVWTQLLSGEQHKEKKPPLARGKSSQDREI